MFLGTLKHNNKIISHISHLTYIEKSNSIHQTSNISFKTNINQKIDSPLPNLTLQTSLNPGTVVSENIEFIPSKNKFV
jgi:hypothetical protein